MKKISLYISQQQFALLKEKFAETGLTVSEHIRRAIDEYLLRNQQRIEGQAQK